MLQLPDCFIGLMAATWPIGAASCTRPLLHPQEQMTNCQITTSWVFTPQQITWAIGQKSQIIWFVKFLNNHKPIFAFVAMAWKSIPTVCSQMCSRKGRAGENLAARPSFAATRPSLLLLRAEILIREENYGARSEGFDLDNFQRELELFCMESHAGQPCADLIKWVTIVW